MRELENCRKNITKTKRLIEYHKKMLKSFESKSAELERKIEKEKMASLCAIINKGGYDIDLIRSAVENGDFINTSEESVIQVENEAVDIEAIKPEQTDETVGIFKEERKDDE